MKKNFKNLGGALMLAAANKAGCTAIYTEDLNDGQVYDTVKTINPFK